MKNKYYTAIVFFNDGQPVRKYRNVQNNDYFARFLVKIGAAYANLYLKDSRQYCGRITV